MTSPGWYPDPLRRYELRYFNGQQWTADVSTNGQHQVDPLGLAPSPPQTWQPVTGAASVAPERPGRGFGIASLILGIGAVVTGWVPFVVVVGAAALVLALVFGIVGLRRARQAGTRNAPAVAGLVLAGVAVPAVVLGVVLTRLTWIEVSAFIEPGPHLITIDGPCTLDDGVVTFSGEIENLSDTRRGYTVSVSIRLDDRRTVLRNAEVDPIDPGAVAPWRLVSVLEAGTVACELDDVFGPTPFGIPMDG